MHVSPTFENFLCTFLPNSDISHNNRSVISIIGVFLLTIAYIFKLFIKMLRFTKCCIFILSFKLKFFFIY